MRLWVACRYRRDVNERVIGNKSLCIVEWNYRLFLGDSLNLDDRTCLSLMLRYNLYKYRIVTMCVV